MVNETAVHAGVGTLDATVADSGIKNQRRIGALRLFDVSSREARRHADERSTR